MARANIQKNFFLKIILSESLSLKKKVKQTTTLLVFINSKEEDHTRVRKFDDFKTDMQPVFKKKGPSNASR